MARWLVAAAVAAIALGSVPVKAERDLPLPRFVSLRTNEVNLRAGPGVRYPIEWVMVRRGMPVEVLAHYDTWRKIRDHQGVEGWVHQQGLTGRRSALVAGAIRALHRRADRGSPVIATLEPGVLLQLSECKAGWCRAEVEGRRGWIAAAEIWGVYPGEEFE
ncbi:MAG: SH3 domain-containing protein [Alphaproteobacteria bacterium]|nr:SH3 domain-containing protein [Alphaproteobacteria bacterium]